MSDTAQVRITKVFDPDGNRPYHILTEDGKRYSTFRAELGEKAKEFQGQAGVIQFDVKQRGEYTNYVYEGFAPDESIQTLDAELTTRPNGAAPNYRQPTHPQEQQSIQRAVALQRAHEWLPYLPDEERTRESVKSLFEWELSILQGDA